ncbi:MAG: D-alanine--D-alanine ligase [Bacilli bacterium]
MKIGLIYGGKSVEHEISIITAMQVYEELSNSYDVINIYFSKTGKFYIGKVLNNIENYKDFDQLLYKCREISFQNINGEVYIVEQNIFRKKHKIDLGFLAMHGETGEDGRLQGFFDIIGLDYTGPSHYGSSIGQDKAFTKDILKANGFNLIDYIVANDSQSFEEIKLNFNKLNYPVVIKPATLGSSVGINFCENDDELEVGLSDSFNYDSKVIIEPKIDKFIEVNCSVLGNYSSAKASVLEEILCDDFLSFESKYTSGNKNSKGMMSTSREIPARISEKLSNSAQKMCVEAFKLLNLSGVVRFDLMIFNNEVYINEVNTIPGSLAFYLWTHSGIEKVDLYKELIKLAIDKKRIKENKVHSYETNVLKNGNFNGKKGK